MPNHTPAVAWSLLSCVIVLGALTSAHDGECAGSARCSTPASVTSQASAQATSTRVRSRGLRRIPVRKDQTALLGPPPILPFPWPPPTATAKYLLPKRILSITDSVSLGEVAALVRDALSRAGVEEYAVYSVKGDSGLAFVTRLERIDADGRPLPLPDRWPQELNSNIRAHSLPAYLKSLFVSSPGYYRMVAIVLAAGPVVANGPQLTAKQADALIGGSQHVPPELMSRFVSGLEATALIYQFRYDKGDAAPKLLAHTSIPPAEQLARSGYWKAEQLRGR
jgi:hypothetical protein